MDKSTRNTLRNAVTKCRRLLEDAVAELLEGRYGIHKNGTIESAEALGALSDEESRCRERALARLTHLVAAGDKKDQAAARLVREIAFTQLNRLVAYKMMEERGLIREAVSRGMSSQGFQFFLADNPEEAALRADGQEYAAYCHFLDSLGSGFSSEIAALFSDVDPANGLYTSEKVLLEVLGLINQAELGPIWAEDEAIGWVYQYFTPKELRDQARKESAAPRNSHELAFLNQFYTPRYVVEFLVDNTLGRFWHEMCDRGSALADDLRYLALPPDEVKRSPGGDRAWEPRDPRTIKVLDPACGSGHFLLYCFDLFERIYHEAYGHPQAGTQLRADFSDPAEFQKAVPGLILGYNLHGIDIDPRAVQISALALWLRAQRSYLEAGIEPNGRPPITRANVVCAEPMPGDADLLNQFMEGLEPPLLRQLVRDVFGRMELASEAGSLLRIEEELRSSLREAKATWLGRPRQEQLELLPELGTKAQEQLAFDVSGITDTEFWDSAEGWVLDALRRFAEGAEVEQGYLRRLFADDAARGFAFIDLCSNRYDVVLMNPPFGAASRPSKAYIEKSYPRTKNDVYAAFVERGLQLLKPGGFLGAITSRTGFFLSSFEKWRDQIVLGEAHPTVFADLGYGVLDTAMVETAAYCLEKHQGSGSVVPNALFLRLLASEDKGADLASSLAALRYGKADARVFEVDPESFRQIPGAPFAYWVSERVRQLFKELPPFEGEGRTVRVGLQTSDDFRFVRAWWEVAPERILDAQHGPDWRADLSAFQAWCRRRTHEGKRWVPFAKGGEYSPYYADIHLVVNWEWEGREIKGFVDPETGKTYSRPQNTEFYFRPGLTWTHRTTSRLSVRVLPSGAGFGHKGPAAFTDSPPDWLGLMQSSAFMSLLETQLGAADVAARSYDVGAVQRTPSPRTLNQLGENLGASVLRIIDEQRSAGEVSETTHMFSAPLGEVSTRNLLEIARESVLHFWDRARRLSVVQSQIDQIIAGLYGVSAADFGPPGDLSTCASAETEVIDVGADHDDTRQVVDPMTLASSLVSYLLGCVFGRWDVRLATGERSLPELPDPFDPLPVCPPGMLQGEDGLPLRSAPEGYPLFIDWDGILVDDPGHPDDLLTRIRQVLEVICGARAGAMEAELTEMLGVKDLREYFRRPTRGGFWLDHVACYSKSRRKAPIYWLLQSKKKNYALWLYYHRLDRDLLYKALVNYVEPKLRLEESRLKELEEARSLAGSTGREAKQLAREAEAQEELVQELAEFAQALSRAAELHLTPDLDDGVLLNIAPLWELVPWREAAATWQELLKGKYSWSSVGQQLRERGVVCG